MYQKEDLEAPYQNNEEPQEDLIGTAPEEYLSDEMDGEKYYEED